MGHSQRFHPFLRFVVFGGAEFLGVTTFAVPAMAAIERESHA
jgi:hypothetical protein